MRERTFPVYSAGWIILVFVIRPDAEGGAEQGIHRFTHHSVWQRESALLHGYDMCRRKACLLSFTCC